MSEHFETQREERKQLASAIIIFGKLCANKHGDSVGENEDDRGLERGNLVVVWKYKMKRRARQQ